MRHFRVLDIITDGSKAAEALKEQVRRQLVSMEPLHGGIVRVELVHNFEPTIKAEFFIDLPNRRQGGWALRRFFNTRFRVDVQPEPVQKYDTDFLSVHFNREYSVADGKWLE